MLSWCLFLSNRLYSFYSCGIAPVLYFGRITVRGSYYYYYYYIYCIAMPGVPKSDRRPVWRRRQFFISSVEDSVLERSAVLESLCFGIGFGRLG